MRKLICLILVAVLLPISTTAQTPPNVPTQFDCQYDLTGQTIKFYHFGDLSLVYSLITLPVLAGFEDAIAYFNANGGICGAEIAHEYQDTGNSRDRAQTIFDEFADRDDVHVMFLYNTEDSELLSHQAEEKKIPLMISSGSVLGLYGENGDDAGWEFAITPLYEDQLGAFCEYISQNWETFGIEGDPVIGHVSWFGAFGQSSDKPESRAYCESLGIGYAGAQYYAVIIPDITAQIQNVLDNGANIIYTTSLATGPIRLAQTIEAMGLESGVDVLLAGPNWVLDTSVVQDGGPSVAGMIGQLPYVWWDEIEHPGVQLATQHWAESRLATDPDNALGLRNIAYLVAWAAVDIYRNFVIDTVNRVGPEGLNGQAIYDSLVSGQAYSGLGGVLTIQYDEHIRAMNQTRLGTIEFIENGDSVTPRIYALTDWRKVPDLRPNGADVIE